MANKAVYGATPGEDDELQRRQRSSSSQAGEQLACMHAPLLMLP